MSAPCRMTRKANAMHMQTPKESVGAKTFLVCSEFSSIPSLNTLTPITPCSSCHLPMYEQRKRIIKQMNEKRQKKSTEPSGNTTVLVESSGNE